ncbi:MAG: hypothetical protein M3224_01240 [Thermoproteota archaeon]|nr:hypothetical protein [Thermoproteota archaeon]MDQ4022334.1 hypothetical protein [Thermoproteota archaeon]
MEIEEEKILTKHYVGKRSQHKRTNAILKSENNVPSDNDERKQKNKKVATAAPDKWQVNELCLSR